MKRLSPSPWPGLALLAALLFPGIATAGNQQMLQLLSILRDNGTLTEEQYQQLVLAMDEEEPAAAPSAPSSPGITTAPDIQLTTEGGVGVQTMDGRFGMRLKGRVMTDAALVQDAVPNVKKGEVKDQLGSAAELRSVRLGLEGWFYGDWEYQLEVDFAGDDTNVGDAWLGYSGFDRSRIRVGAIKEPFGLEEQTSALNTTFMEPALPGALVPGRNVGIAYDTHGERWSLGLGLFGEGLDDGDDNDVGDEGWGGGFRATYAPIAGARRALHLGLAANYRTYGANPDYEDSRLRLRSRPESHVADTWLLDTDDDLVAVDAATRLGLEAAAVLGSFSLQGEYLQAGVTRGDGQPDLLFDGYYVYASWFLTGESRNYDARHGEFDRIRPLRNFGRGGPGAWEFGLRYSALDLEDEDIEGGVARNFTLGVNWYLNPQLRLMANYIWVDTEPDVFGNDNDPRILQLRAQYDF